MATGTDQIRSIDRRQFQVGMALPGHLRDPRGGVLLSAGEVLTGADLSRLAGQARFASSDWRAEPAEQRDADSVLEALAEQRPPTWRRDNRSHPRHRWSVTLALLVEERTEHFMTRRQIRVTTHDISVGGFAFVNQHYIHHGTLVSACFECLADRPTLPGVVKSCVAAPGGRYRVGVQFMRISRRHDST